ncbi:hypothetical protein, partial [Zhouia amylolytica]|uniref:hypothetical protein n=1 Tax=Zhouia amylolytica TaxID=376730 RepID=UPI0020CBBCC1
DDTCSNASVTYNEVRTDGACPNAYTLTRTWIATDECGNNTEHIQTITVQDTTAPVAPAAPVDVTVECTDEIPAMVDL